MAERLLCGVDLGGTKLSVGLFSQGGELKCEQKVGDHSRLGCDAMVRRVADLVRDLLRGEGMGLEDVLGIGVGMAGHINPMKGIVLTSTNFPVPFRRYPFRGRLESELGCPVILENDANAQAFGEYRFGAGRGSSSMVFLTVSTGVGAGIVINGRIFRGHSGFAGEVGHAVIDPHSPVRCTCGNRGCLTALSGTLGLPERYRLCLEEGMHSSPPPDKVDTLDGMALERRVAAGDEIAMHLLQESADYLGIGIYNIYQIFNPQSLILGGGLMNLGYGFFERIKEKFESLVQNMVDEKLEIGLTELGGRAGLIGAAALSLEPPIKPPEAPPETPPEAP